MYRRCFKRILDIIFALIGLPFFLLLYIAVSIAIKLDDRGRVFYVSKRIGKHARLFNMLKFRTMREGAPDIRLSDGSTYSAPDDERMTRAGRLLRKTSLDETPQIINILIGDMSFIGPRPDLPDSLSVYTQEDNVLLCVRPGITGYNQAYFRNSADSRQKIDNDVYYAQHYSFGMDTRIILKTVMTVLCKQYIYRQSNDSMCGRSVDE